jgi:hypothetical protein
MRIYEFDSQNIRMHRDMIATLNYTPVTIIAQPWCTNFTSINAYNVSKWVGTMILSPDSDVWTDTSQRPAVVTNFNGTNDGWVEGKREGFGTIWGNWSGSSTTYATSNTQTISVSYPDPPPPPPAPVQVPSSGGGGDGGGGCTMFGPARDCGCNCPPEDPPSVGMGCNMAITNGCYGMYGYVPSSSEQAQIALGNSISPPPPPPGTMAEQIHNNTEYGAWMQQKTV